MVRPKLDYACETWDPYYTKDREDGLYKISHNLVGFNADKYLELNPESRIRGSHLFKYTIPKAKKNVFKYSYLPKNY